MDDNAVYNKKLELIKATVACENTETATALVCKLAPIINSGMTFGDFFSDPFAGGKRITEYIMHIESESIPITALHNHLFYDILYPLGEVWLSHIRQPGLDISKTAVWQIVEFENMQKQDYYGLCSRGYSAMKQWLLPRAFADKYEDYIKWRQSFYSVRGQFCDFLRESGFFDISNVYPFVSIPFETFSGARGARNFFMDCHTNPKMVKAAIDSVWPGVKAEAIERIRRAKRGTADCFGLMIGCWRCGPAMINHKLFSELVWPYLKDFGESIITEGIVPIYHLDMNWLREMEAFKELPEKKIIINIDGATDMVKTREILGDNYCILGGFPGTLLNSKNPVLTTNFIKKTADKIGGKGIFWGCGCEPPATASTESFINLFSAIGKYVN